MAIFYLNPPPLKSDWGLTWLFFLSRLEKGETYFTGLTEGIECRNYG